MSAFLSAVLICVGVGATVWTRTNDPWITSQITAATVTLFVSMGVVSRILERFDDAPRPESPPAPVSGPPSASWLIPGLGTGDGSARHLTDRTIPALRELAAERLRSLHGVDLEDPSDAARARALLGDRAWAVVTRPRPVRVSRRGTRSRRQATTQTIDLLEGVEGL